MLKSIHILSIIVIFGLLIIWGCSGDKNPTNNQPIGNQAPLIPFSPSPADGATEIPANSAFSWQCNNPNNDSLLYMVYMGIDSLYPTYFNWSDSAKSFTPPWKEQSQAKEMLMQIYEMEMAYHDHYGSYCLNGVTADSQHSTYFNLIDITIDSADCYSYCICAPGSTFMCTAIATNLDDDATMDAWRIDQTGALYHTISDFGDQHACDFQPHTRYMWQIKVMDYCNDYNDTIAGPIWYFMTGDSL